MATTLLGSNAPEVMDPEWVTAIGKTILGI